MKRLIKKKAMLFDNYYFNNLLNQASQTIQKYIAIATPPGNFTVGNGDNQGFYNIQISMDLKNVSVSMLRETIKQKLLEKLEKLMQYPFEELTNPKYEQMGTIKTAFNSLYSVVLDCYYANQIEEQKRNK